RREVNQLAEELRSAISGHTTRDDFTFGPRDHSATHGTILRRFECFFLSGAFRRHDAEHFGNDLAALLDHYPVADLYAKAFDLIFVVQSGSRDSRAGEKYGFEKCHWCQCAGASDGDKDVQNFC